MPTEGISGSTRKRPRTHSASNSDVAQREDVSMDQEQHAGGSSPRRRDEELWFEDGTVILVARDVEFRVYRGILADRSPVFKDMFSLPQPREVEPSKQAEVGDFPCPVVHVTDSPEDLRHILRIHIPRGDPNPFKAQPPSYYQMSACIRLGHKYQMSKLVEHATNYLKEYYTTDLSVWKNTSGVPPGWLLEHAIGVIGLARLTDEHSLLPVAFLHCCFLGETLVNGCKREDGSREHLSLDDIGRCFKAKDELFRTALQVALRAYHPSTAKGCKTHRDCRDEFRAALSLFDEHVKTVLDPDAFKSYSDIFGDEVDLCTKCYALLDESDLEERQAAWQRLPAIFGLEIEGWGNVVDDETD